MPTARRFDLPVIEPETQPWWDAAAEGRLLVKRCAACGEAHFYPRPFCPSCWSDDVEWEEASGRATLHTWSVIHRNDLPPFDQQVPYVGGLVDLAEGPRMETRVVDCNPADLRVDMALEVTFRSHTDDLSIPMFRPAEAA